VPLKFAQYITVYINWAVPHPTTTWNIISFSLTGKRKSNYAFIRKNQIIIGGMKK